MDYLNGSLYNMDYQNSPIVVNDYTSYLNPISQSDLSAISYPSPGAGKKYIMPVSPIARRKSTSITYLDDFAGELDFQVRVPSNKKREYVVIYSKKLSKVYLNMAQALPLDFSYTPLPSSSTLHIRTAMAFRDDSERRKVVRRCYAHRAVDEPQPTLWTGLVFRPTHALSTYHEDENGVMSTLVPVDETSNDNVRLTVRREFRFYCKNSCPTGINRRPTKMVFALEDGEGKVLGRTSLHIQICSCPKRDRDRDEQEQSTFKAPSAGKRTLMKSKPPSRPPQQPGSNGTCGDSGAAEDLNVYTVNLEVLGTENSRAVLRYAYDVMAAQAIKTGNHEAYRPHMEDLLRKMRGG